MGTVLVDSGGYTMAPFKFALQNQNRTRCRLVGRFMHAHALLWTDAMHGRTHSFCMPRSHLSSVCLLYQGLCFTHSACEGCTGTKR